MSFSFGVFKWIEFELNKPVLLGQRSRCQDLLPDGTFFSVVTRLSGAGLTRLETKKVGDKW